MIDEEVGGSPFGLDAVHEEVEVHAIDGFDFENGVLGDDFFDGLGYHGMGSGRCQPEMGSILLRTNGTVAV